VKGAGPELAKRVTTLFTPNIHWRRARRWELMDLLLMVKQSLAFDKFCTGDFLAVALEIVEAFELIHAAGKARIAAAKSDDQDLFDSFARWCGLSTNASVRYTSVLVLFTVTKDDITLFSMSAANVKL